MSTMRTTPEFKNVMRRIIIGAPLVTPSEQALAMQLQENDVEKHTTKIRPTIRLTKTEQGIRVEAMVGDLRVAVMDTVRLASGDTLTLDGVTMEINVEIFDR
jgi:flagellar motor switch protein FliM